MSRDVDLFVGDLVNAQQREGLYSTPCAAAPSPRLPDALLPQGKHDREL